MTLQEFLMLMLQTAINGLHTFLGSLAPIIQWVVYFCAGLPMVLLGIAGWKFLIKPAWNQSVAMLTAFGKDIWKMMFRIIIVTVVFVLLFFSAIWLSPRLGNGALVVAADGLRFTPASPPLAGSTTQPLLDLNSLLTPQPTLPGTTPIPGSTPTSGAALAPSGPTGSFTVTDPTGATVRSPGADNICADNDQENGETIATGTTVTILSSWPSTNIPGFRGLTSTGQCVHLSAFTASP